MPVFERVITAVRDGVRYGAAPRSATNGERRTTEQVMTSSVSATAFLGVQRGMHGLQREAHKIASSANQGFETAEIAQSLVNAKSFRQSIAANLRVIEHADRALGRLLDILV
jgi:hypothetical protein